MSSTEINRRNFLAAIGVLAAGSVTPALSQLTSTDDPEFWCDNEYLFAPGLIYMNTGTIGPCSKKTVEETTVLWKQLESLPLQFYPKFAPALAEKTRTIAASFFGCDLDEIMITKSTTEGMNAIAQGLRLLPGDRIITTNQEHDGALNGWNYMARYYGVLIDTITIPFDTHDPALLLENLSKAITPQTKLISISHVFSSTGLRLPVAEISKLARSKGILCVVDGAQAAGAIKVNLKELGCHAYATSGHKWLMGPKGTGLLYISKEVQNRIRPIQFEYSYNTFNESAGVGNLPGILGLASAIDYLNETGIEKAEQKNLSLRNRLYYSLLNETTLNIQSPPPGAMASPLLSCRLPENIDAGRFSSQFLETHKISFRPVHKKWFNGIRFSLHVFNTEEEVDKLVRIIKKELSS
jgi:selenocysteine lyase/cysteine desulfurase